MRKPRSPFRFIKKYRVALDIYTFLDLKHFFEQGILKKKFMITKVTMRADNRIYDADILPGPGPSTFYLELESIEK